MRALLVLNYDVVDAERLDSYRVAASDAILGDDGRLLASTQETVALPEGTETGNRTVVIEYPSRAAAEARYGSAAYQALLPERLAATVPRAAFIVELGPVD